MGLPEHDLARWEREQDCLAREESWINDRVEELVNGGEYDPSIPEVFLETLADAGNDLARELRPLLRQIPWDVTAIGNAICGWVEEKCGEQAAMKAEDELEEMKWQ